MEEKMCLWSSMNGIGVVLFLRPIIFCMRKCVRNLNSTLRMSHQTEMHSLGSMDGGTLEILIQYE